MQNFCTLFDINFISQGLVMYKSLLKYCNDDFMLYIFAFCEDSYKILKDLQLKNAEIISVTELEQKFPDLLSVKDSRTRGEYCWTCSSATILYCLKEFNLGTCTYLDADLSFFANPKILIDEIGDSSILLTEHRDAPIYDTKNICGKYCVQFAFFRNDANGLEALNWWFNACIGWCFNRIEDGRFGDQKYLDDWPTRYKGVHVLKHLGGGVAPWNVPQYKIYYNKNRIFVKDNQQDVPIIFYHFQDIKPVDGNLIMDKSYKNSKAVKKLLYKPYIQNLIKESQILHKKYKKVRVLKIPKFSLFNKINKFRQNIIKFKFGKNGYLAILNKRFFEK